MPPGSVKRCSGTEPSRAPVAEVSRAPPCRRRAPARRAWPRPRRASTGGRPMDARSRLMSSHHVRARSRRSEHSSRRGLVRAVDESSVRGWKPPPGRWRRHLRPRARSAFARLPTSAAARLPAARTHAGNTPSSTAHARSGARIAQFVSTPDCRLTSARTSDAAGVRQCTTVMSLASTCGQLVIGGFPGATLPAGFARALARAAARRRHPLQAERRRGAGGRGVARPRGARSGRPKSPLVGHRPGGRSRGPPARALARGASDAHGRLVGRRRVRRAHRARRRRRARGARHHDRLRAGARRQHVPGEPRHRRPRVRRRRRRRARGSASRGSADCSRPGSSRAASTSPGTATPRRTRTSTCPSSPSRATASIASSSSPSGRPRPRASRR